MANDLSEEQRLALWMLDRMRDSEEFLAILRASRAAGSPDPLDTPDRIARHGGRLAGLYQTDSSEPAEVPEELVGVMAGAGLRDLLSCPEELIEKAIAAYLKQHPSGEDDLPTGWKTTFALAEDEIKGVSRGNFAPDFVALLAGRAREEQARAGMQHSRDAERERD